MLIEKHVLNLSVKIPFLFKKKMYKVSMKKLFKVYTRYHLYIVRRPKERRKNFYHHYFTSFFQSVTCTFIDCLSAPNNLFNPFIDKNYLLLDNLNKLFFTLATAKGIQKLVTYNEKTEIVSKKMFEIFSSLKLLAIFFEQCKLN